MRFVEWTAVSIFRFRRKSIKILAALRTVFFPQMETPIYEFLILLFYAVLGCTVVQNSVSLPEIVNLFGKKVENC